jgi:hypothetical protein
MAAESDRLRSYSRNTREDGQVRQYGAGCRLAVSFALSTFQRSLLTLYAYGRPSKPPERKSPAGTALLTVLLRARAAAGGPIG